MPEVRLRCNEFRERPEYDTEMLLRLKKLTPVYLLNPSVIVAELFASPPSIGAENQGLRSRGGSLVQERADFVAP